MFAYRNLRLARDSRMMSQSELTQRTGISQATLSKIEKGLVNVTDSQIKTLSETLEYPISFLRRKYHPRKTILCSIENARVFVQKI